ncbi:putative reverse transcriptase domain-containing protein [Tanacetum coccineum]
MPLSTYLNLGLGELAHTKLTIKLADKTMKYPKGFAKNVLVGIGKFVFPIDFIILDMTEDIKVPLILGRPFFSTAHAKIDVFKRKITFRVGEEKIIFKSVKPASCLIKRVYMLSLREKIELDLEARLMGETLVLNRSLDPFFEDYIELNDLNVPLELRSDQVDDLMPTIEEGKVVEEFRAWNDARMFGLLFWRGFVSKRFLSSSVAVLLGNIQKSIDEVPFSDGTILERLLRRNQVSLQLGPERARVYSDLSPEDKDRYNADIRATNIILQGLPKDIYSLINHYTDAKDIWDNVKMLLEGSELTKEDRESQLYDDFENFCQNKRENIHDYYVWFAKLINDMRNIKMTMSRMQLNSKFVNNMLPE